MEVIVRGPLPELEIESVAVVVVPEIALKLTSPLSAITLVTVGVGLGPVGEEAPLHAAIVIVSSPDRATRLATPGHSDRHAQ